MRLEGGMSIPVLKQLMYVDQVRISPLYNHLYPLFSPYKNQLQAVPSFFYDFLPEFSLRILSSRQLIWSQRRFEGICRSSKAKYHEPQQRIPHNWEGVL